MSLQQTDLTARGKSGALWCRSGPTPYGAKAAAAAAGAGAARRRETATGSDPEAPKSAERPPEAAESGFRAEGPGRLHRTSIAELRSRKSTGRLTTMVLYGPLPVHAHRRFRLTKRFRNSGPALFAL